MDERAFAKWTAIVLTCRNGQTANALQKGALLIANVYCVWISHFRGFTAFSLPVQFAL